VVVIPLEKMRDNMIDDLQQAIALIKSGEKKRGGQMLAEIVKRDPRNINAWLWLASCVNIDEQRIYCLKRVLEIDPNHNVALTALSKLQQPEQPSEKEILGNSELPPKSVSNAQIRQIPSSSQNINAKSHTFQPKYLTALAGMGVMVGTVFPWAALWLLENGRTVSPGDRLLEEYSGFTVAPGILTAIIGLAIVFFAIFQRTKPGKANSLISSLFALVTFLMVCSWVVFFNSSCMDSYFNPKVPCYQNGKGFGYELSMASLFFTFIFGLIPNPKEQ
jgi:hypothetical protein